MMKKLLVSSVLLLAMLLPLRNVAQQDTLFWFAAPEISNSIGDDPVYLRFLSYANPATITISQPANGGFAPITVNLAANDVASVDLTPFLADIESPAANVASTNGLKITSSSNVTAYYELVTAGNREIFSLKGQKALGTNFYTPMPNAWDNGTTTPASFSSFEVVATADNTTVLITPRANITGHAMNATFSVVLNEGETYSARDTDGLGSTSLSGSIISSNNPVAVTIFSGAQDNAGCLSTIGDQITTAAFAGRDFILHRGTATGERVYIMATQNGTTINIDNNSGNTNTLINWSETYEFTLTDDINSIRTNKPVYVLHVNGNGCDLSGAQLPNVFCAGTYNSAFSRGTADSLGVLLYVRTGFEGDFALNGNPALIPASQFNVVPGTGGAFQVARIYFNTTDVPVDSYNEITNTGDIFGMALMNGENGTGTGYAWLSEFTSYPFIDAGPDDTICANVGIAINGVIGGGDVTGSWGSTGFGTFQNGFTSLTNTYVPSPLDTLISPISLILTTTGPCPVLRDTLLLDVTPAPIVSASADQIVCANNAVVNLSGSVAGATNTGIWSTPNGTGVFTPNDSTLNADYIPSPADTLAGSVTLVLTSTNIGSCVPVTDTMTVTITTAPTVDAGADTIMVCSNNALVTLSGSVIGPSSTGKWTTSGNGSFSPSNLNLNATYAPTPTDISGGSVWIFLESTNNGTCTPVKDSLIVIFSPEPTVDAGANIISCANDPAVDLSGLVSGPTTTGQWSGGGGTFSPNDQDLNATYTPSAAEINSGSVFLTLTSTNNGNCNSENDNVQINFVTPPFANFSFTQVCFGETTDFTDFSLPGFGSLTNWDWDFGDNTTSTTQNNTQSYQIAGNYNVELIVTNSAGCMDTTSQTVSVFEIPEPGFTWSAACTNDQVLVSFTDTSTTLNDTINNWFYDFGGQGSQSTQNPTQLFVGSGNFVVTQIVSTVNGCMDSTVQIINLPDRPEAGFFYNTSNGLNIGANFNFFDTSYNAVSWFWDFDDGNSSNLQDPTNTYFANGTYFVTQYVTGVLGCTDSAVVLITINTVTTEVEELIPNAISPNGDGKNDTWKLDFIPLYYPDAQITVFNRWGQEVFASTGYSEPWTGSFRGVPVPDGTYYYVINLNDATKPEPFTGAILVLRKAE